MSSNNSIRPRGRGRGSFRSKYVTRSNLHVIATHVPAAPISTSKKKPIPKNIKKETILVSGSSKSPKNCSVGQEIKSSAVTNKDTEILKTESCLPKAESGAPKTDSVLPKTESGLLKTDSEIQKKEESQKSNSKVPLYFSSDTTRKERQAKHATANFFMLHKLDKIIPKTKTAPPKKVFFPQLSEVVNKTGMAPQNESKAVKKELVQTKKFANQDLKKKSDESKRYGPNDHKIKPSQTKFSPYKDFNKNKKDSDSPFHSKADKPVDKKKRFSNKNAAQREKESPYHDGDFTGRPGDKKKARLDMSPNFDSHKRREPSFWDEGSNSGGAYFRSEQEEMASRKKSRTSRDYLRSIEEEMYYKNKYKKLKKKDYEWKESEPYPAYDKYNWYSKDYKLKKKKLEEQYAFNKYSDYPIEGRDFEEVEDFEEVASVESKVPVRFRKCIVRYLPYKIYSYFRPKWYYLSRKRFIVNCMYATGKEGKITSGKGKDTKWNEERMMDENLIESGMEVPEEECMENFEMLEVVPDDDDIIGEVSAQDDETISDEVSVHEDETVIDEVSVNEDETIINEVSIHEDEAIIDEVSVHEDETIIDEVSVHGDSVEKDLSEHKENDIEPALLNKDIKTQNKIAKSFDVKISPKKVQAVQNTGNQTTPKKNSSPGKRNSIPVIDLCSDTMKTEKTVGRNSSSVATSDSGALENPEIIVKDMEIQVIDLEEEENDTVAEKSERNLEKDNETDPSIIKESINDIPESTRKFLKCNSSLAFTSDFNQGVAIIQSSLAKWKSHLIGLEYMLEIRDNIDEAVVKKYHCGLCDDDIPVEKTAGQIVINHIISYSHMCNYMEK